MTGAEDVEPYEILPAQGVDWPAIREVVTAGGLPLDGLEDHLATTIVARDGGGILGCAALELYGADALLRSVAVSSERRRHGIGLALTSAAIQLAHRHGVRTLWLLTETAAEFFPRFGFEPTSRAAVPASVRESVEFTSACPESATVMTLPLRAAS